MKKRGFTLVEAIVAVFVFSLAMVMISKIFAVFLKSSGDAKRIQRSFENIQFALNNIAKTSRTSKFVAIETSIGVCAKRLKIYDYSQGKCVQYCFDSTEKSLKSTADVPTVPDDISKCAWPTTYSNLTEKNSIESADFIAGGPAGHLNSRLTVSVQARGEKTVGIPAQMSVSFRN